MNLINSAVVGGKANGAGEAAAVVVPRQTPRVPRQTRDLRICEVRPLIPPAILAEEIPLTAAAADLVLETRAAVTEIVTGGGDRLVAIVGPCSIHDVDAGREFGVRLRRLALRFEDDLLILMRAYLEKPRTGIGWKGLVNDPDLDGTCRINHGLRLARTLLADLNELGMPTASEFLDTQIPQHISDLTSWVAIGARTTESQVHRELASGLSMPVGFKNGTGGNTRVAVDAVLAARSPHWFPSVTVQGVSAIFHTIGNDACHVILRGGGQSGPNYDAAHVAAVCRELGAHELPARVMVDCSHGNSIKDYRKQSGVVEDVCAQIAEGSSSIFGVMLESNLREGRQDYRSGHGLVYGQSITDGCLSIEQTEPLLEGLAVAHAARRRSGSARV